MGGSFFALRLYGVVDYIIMIGIQQLNCNCVAVAPIAPSLRGLSPIGDWGSKNL